VCAPRAPHASQFISDFRRNKSKARERIRRKPQGRLNVVVIKPPVAQADIRKTAPAWGQNAGAATFSRFVSTIPWKRRIRLWATLQVPKSGPNVDMLGLRRPLASSATFRVLFTIGQTLPSFPGSNGRQRQMGTRYSIWLSEYEYLLWPRRTSRWGHFLLD
jgi:hypothetical protein